MCGVYRGLSAPPAQASIPSVTPLLFVLFPWLLSCVTHVDRSPTLDEDTAPGWVETPLCAWEQCTRPAQRPVLRFCQLAGVDSHSRLPCKSRAAAGLGAPSCGLSPAVCSGARSAYHPTPELRFASCSTARHAAACHMASGSRLLNESTELEFYFEQYSGHGFRELRNIETSLSHETYDLSSDQLVFSFHCL